MSKGKEPKKVLILTSWSVDEPLMQTYVLPNVRIIQNLKNNSTNIFIATFEKKKIANLQSHKGINWVQLSYSNFGIKALALYVVHVFQLIKLIRNEKITHLHAFAPVAGTLGLILKFFTSRILIVDSWEPHADCMVESGAWKKNSLAYYLLKHSEKLQSKHADILIATSKKMPEYAIASLGPVKGKILYRPACVDLSIMKHDVSSRIQLRNEKNWNENLVLVCVSKFGGLYLKEDIFRFFRIGLDIIGEKLHILLISANTSAEINALAFSNKIPSEHFTHIQCQPNEIPKWLSASDVAVNPQCPIPSKRYGTPVKDGEYWAMGLPLIILPEISEDSDIVVQEKAGIILKSLSSEDMKTCFQELQEYLKTNPNHHEAIRKVAEKYRSYDLAVSAYSEIYDPIKAQE